MEQDSAPDTDEEFVELIRDFFANIDAREEALRLLQAGRPTTALNLASSEIRLYVAALETDRERLESEIQRLVERVEELEGLGDTPWYDATLDAEAETFGDEAEAQVDWGLLARDRARVHRLEAVAREAETLEAAAGAGDRESMLRSVARLRDSLVRLRAED